MGRRRSKNVNAGGSYALQSYHIKQKCAQEFGSGSKTTVVGRDSLKDFTSCSLSLHPCADPVVTPDGWLYEREAILEYILHHKIEL